jgi:tetratricopeptide (TPR) repeat protein
MTCAICVLATGLLALAVVQAHPDVDWQISQMTARIEADPRDVQLYLKRGELHRIHRDWSAAESDFRRARELQPDLAAVDFYIGQLKLDANLPKQAKQALDRFLAKEPDHARARIARARALVRLGQPLVAVRDYDRALQAYGKDHRPEPAYYPERAQALASAGTEHVDKAVRGLDEGLERLGRPVTLQLYALELELERGRHDAALERLEQIASRANRQESWLVRRGEILESAGRLAEARSAYAAALDAIEALPVSRRGSRAMQRLQVQAQTAVERLDANASTSGD